jgi:hypothetical protein
VVLKQWHARLARGTCIEDAHLKDVEEYLPEEGAKSIYAMKVKRHT